ncbi:hypothetical protein Barb7_01980 [Bacteroidales bacterium Barb7]|nr:hypothetical protein Barb7_01980 [Bacteroidales bacterium Barb7]
MKTIRQIADEIGVSKQAVQKRIAREPLYTCIQPYISTVVDTKYIADIGENLIKEAFNKLEYIQVADNLPTTNQDSVYSVLKATIDTLQGQLAVKDKQIDELIATVQAQAESINADRKNELAGTLIDGQKRFFGREDNNKKKKWQFWK